MSTDVFGLGDKAIPNIAHMYSTVPRLKGTLPRAKPRR